MDEVADIDGTQKRGWRPRNEKSPDTWSRQPRYPTLLWEKPKKFLNDVTTCSRLGSIFQSTAYYNAAIVYVDAAKRSDHSFIRI